MLTIFDYFSINLTVNKLRNEYTMSVKNINTKIGDYRLQTRIPRTLECELEEKASIRILGKPNTKSTIVALALVMLFNKLENTTMDELYVEHYLPFLKEQVTNGDD